MADHVVTQEMVPSMFRALVDIIRCSTKAAEHMGGARGHVVRATQPPFIHTSVHSMCTVCGQNMLKMSRFLLPFLTAFEFFDDLNGYEISGRSGVA